MLTRNLVVDKVVYIRASFTRESHTNLIGSTSSPQEFHSQSVRYVNQIGFGYIRSETSRLKRPPSSPPVHSFLPLHCTSFKTTNPSWIQQKKKSGNPQNERQRVFREGGKNPNISGLSLIGYWSSSLDYPSFMHCGLSIFLR